MIIVNSGEGHFHKYISQFSTLFFGRNGGGETQKRRKKISGPRRRRLKQQMSAKAKDQHQTNTHDNGLAAQKKSEQLHLLNTRFFLSLSLAHFCLLYHISSASCVALSLIRGPQQQKNCGGIGVRISPWRESKGLGCVCLRCAYWNNL